MMKIKKEEPSAVNKSLGIQLALTGDQSKQKVALKEKSKVFAAQIRARKYNKITILWTFINSFFLSMMYPMVAIYFIKTTRADIIRSTVRATLSSAGLDVYHPYFLQKFIHIKTLFQESLRNSQTVRLLRMNVKAFQIEIGVPVSITNTAYDRRTYDFYTPQRMVQSNVEVCFKS